jgi:hypothetical protein
MRNGGVFNMSYNPFQRGTSAPASSAARFNQNATGSMIPKGTPVKLTSAGIALIDVSVESEVDAFAGVTSEDTLNSADAPVVTSGTIQDITTSFSVGSPIYISKLGTLTNLKPTLGENGFASGDFVIKIGMIAKNAQDPAKKDLVIGINIFGSL